jgi:hypothetical protein
VIDTSKAGMRCRLKKTIRAHEATLEADSPGTIVHEIENLGRRMVLVNWDGNATLYVFLEEIEIEGEAAS